MKKLLIIFIFWILLCSAVGGAPISAPVFNDTSFTGEDLQGSVLLGKDSINPEVEVLKPDNNNNFFEIGNDGSFIVPGDYLTSQGVYKIRFRDENFVFPEHGWFRLFINRKANEYNDYYLEFVYSNSQSWSCEPFDDDFSCGFGHYQASEINRFAKLYHTTKNESYFDILSELVQAEWTEEDREEYCEPNVNFNCSKITNDISPSTYVLNGSFRQGMIIKKLWEAYAYTNEKILNDLAINFSKGSAEECDVHSGDFDCRNSKDQGVMIQGYATAYKNTLNESYKNILINLVQNSNLEKPHSELIKGFSIADPFIEEDLENNIQEMIKSLLGKNCNDCDDEKLISTQNMLIDAYNYDFSKSIEIDYNNVTLDYLIQRELFDLFSSENQVCSHKNEFYECENPLTQSRKAKLYYDLAYNFDTFKSGFYDLRMDSASLHNGINLSIKFLGEIKEPKIFIKEDAFILEDNFNNYTLGRNGTFEISEEYFGASTFLQIFFKDVTTGKRFPYENYIMVPIPLQTPGDVVETSELISVDPKNYCSPFIDNDFACRYEYMQGEYMAGIGSALGLGFNSAVFNNLTRLSNEIIDPLMVYSTCDPLLDEYKCREFIDDPFVLTQPGVYRAASLAKGYLQSYKINNELRLLKDAQILLSQNWDECSLKEGDFDCGEKNQGKILSAVALLYETTGDKAYHKWLESLIEESISSGYKNTSTDVLGMLKSYPYANNSELKEFIESGINETIKKCKEPDECEPIVYYESLESAFLSFQLFNEHELFGLAQELMSSSPTTHLYCNPSIEHENYVCEYPDEQGTMLSGFSVLENNYVVTDDTELNVTMRGGTTGEFEDLLEINCTVENIDNVSLHTENLYFQTEQTLVNGSSTQYIDELPPDDRITFNYTLNLTTGGRSSNICRILAFDDSLPLNVTDIGEILDINYNTYVNEFTGKNLTINLTNIHNFLLEDLQIDFKPSFNDSQINESTINDSLKIDLFEARDTILVDYRFNNLTDGFHNLTINSTSSFDGGTNHTVYFYTVNNSLPIDVNYTDKPLLYDTKIISLNITNNKPFNLTNSSISAMTSDGAIIEDSNKKFNLSKNSTNMFNFSVYYNKSGPKNISFNVISNEGINLFQNVTTNVSSEIIDIDGENQETGLNESLNFPITVSNIGSINQTNISIFLEKSQDLGIDNIILPDEFYYGHYINKLSNSSLPLNFSNVKNNLSSSQKNVSINFSGRYNFSLSFNDTYTDKYIPTSSLLKINYSYNGTETGNVSILHSNTSKDTGCRINESKSKTLCSLEPGLNESKIVFSFDTPENSSYYLDLFSVNITNEYKYYQSYPQLTNSSLPLNFSELKNNITKKGKKIYINWSDSHNFSFELNESLTPGHAFDKSELEIHYNYSGRYPGEVYVSNNETNQKTECFVTNSTNKTICELKPLDENFNISFLFNSTSNITLDFFEVKNIVKNPKDRLKTYNDTILADYLKPQESFSFDLDTQISSDNQELLVLANSSENGTGKLVIEIEEEDEHPPREPSPGRGRDDGPSRELPAGPGRDEMLHWNYDELYTFKNSSKKEPYLKNYFNESYDRGLDFNKTFKKINCLNVTRNFNLTSNETVLNITNICDDIVENVYFYERIGEEYIFNSTKNKTHEFSNYTLFNKDNISSYSSSYLNYTLLNVDHGYIDDLYENFSVHIQEKDETIKIENETKKKFFHWNYTTFNTFEEIIEYEPEMRNFLDENFLNISFNRTLERSNCLVASRSIEISSNLTQFSIKNLCEEDIDDLFIYENISMDFISNLSYENYTKLEKGFIIQVPILSANNTFKINYNINNVSLNETYLIFNESHIHIKEPFKEPDEPLFDFNIEKEHLFSALFIVLLTSYIILIRYNVLTNPLRYLDPSRLIIYITKQISKLKRVKIVPDFVTVRVNRLERKWSYFKLRYFGKYPLVFLIYIKRTVYKIKNTRFLPRVRKNNLTPLEQKLFDINLKLKYANKLYEKNKYKESENLLTGVPLLILSAVHEANENYKQKDKDKINFLLKKSSTIYTNLQLNIHNELYPSKKEKSYEKKVTKTMTTKVTDEQKENKKPNKFRQEKMLMDINIKLKHAENSYLSGDASESERSLNEVPFLILSVMEISKGKYNKEIREKINFLLNKASNIYNQTQQLKEDDLKSNSKQKTKGEDDSYIEVNLYTKLLKIKQLNEKKELDRALEEIERVKRGIEELDQHEKKKERLMLLKKLKECERINKKMRDTVLGYKLKKFFRFQDSD